MPNIINRNTLFHANMKLIYTSNRDHCVGSRAAGLLIPISAALDVIYALGRLLGHLIQDAFTLTTPRNFTTDLAFLGQTLAVILASIPLMLSTLFVPKATSLMFAPPRSPLPRKCSFGSDTTEIDFSSVELETFESGVTYEAGDCYKELKSLFSSKREYLFCVKHIPHYKLRHILRLNIPKDEKSLEIAKLLQNSIFAKFRLRVPPKLIIQTDVLTGGSGDLFNMLNGVRALKAAYPTADVTAIYRHKQPLPNFNPEEYLTDEAHLVDLDESEEAISTLSARLNAVAATGPTDDPEVKALLLKMQSSDACITFPISNTKITELFNTHAADVPRLYLGEYSCDHVDLNMRVRDLSLDSGVGTTQEGIFLPDLHPNGTFDSAPNLTELYNDPTKKYFCYAYDILSEFAEVVSIKEKASSKDITIVGPYKNTHITRALLHQLKAQGITQVILKTPDGELETHATGLSTGKTLTLYVPGRLNHSNFINCMHLSEDLVGCTGDMSLSEVLALGKVPYYEIRGHKQNFWMGMVGLLAGYAPGADLHLFAAGLLNPLSSERVKKVKAYVTQPKIYDGLKLAVKKIRAYNRLEHSMVARVNQLLFNKNASTAAKAAINKLNDDFSKKNISASQYAAGMKRVLRTYGDV